MTKNAPKKKAMYSRYVKTVVMLAVIVSVSYWAYWSYYLAPNEQPNITSNAQLTNTILFPSTSTTTSSPTYTFSLQPSDFSMTNSSGCEFFNQSTTETEIRFDIVVTNRQNSAVDYVNASIAVVGSAITYGNYVMVSYREIVAGPTHTAVLRFHVYIPISGAKDFGGGGVTGGTFEVEVFIREPPNHIETIALSPKISISPPYPRC